MDGSLALLTSGAPGEGTTLWRTERPAGVAAFTPPEPVVEEPGGLRDIAYARTRAGQEAIAWTRQPDGVAVRVRPAPGAPLGPVEALPVPEGLPAGLKPEPGRWEPLDVALGSDGALAVSLCTTDGEGRGVAYALVFFRAPGTDGAWQSLGRCAGTMRLRSDALGRIDVLWSGADDGAPNPMVHVASRLPGAPAFGSGQTLSDPSEHVEMGSAPQLLTTPAGEAVALWNPGDYPVGNRIMAAVRDATGTWSAPRRISAGSAGFRPSAAANLHGDVAIGWEDGQQFATAVRRPGGVFGAPVVASVGEVWAQTMPIALDSFGTIVGAATGVRRENAGLYAVRRLANGQTLPTEPITSPDVIAAGARIVSDPFGNGALVFHGGKGRPVREWQTFVAPYSARPPVLEDVRVAGSDISFDLDEPASIDVRVHAGRRAAVRSFAVTPQRGRERLRGTGRLRTLLRARGVRRVVLRARDAGPGRRTVRRVLR
jgi:hypothetical protein